MTTVLFVRRFLADYARNPVNLLVLVLVPVVFVVVAAGSMADAAQLLGGAGGGPAVETATAGWAAGFLAGIAMYFQVAAARDADRRLVIAGLPGARLVAARLLAGLVLALLVSTAALVALALRTGIDEPARVASGTLMFAVIYLAIGAVVAAVARNPVNGTVLMFVWIIDVFFGPTLSAADRVGTRGLPTHFVSLWMVDLPPRHGGRVGDIGWALVWTIGAAAVAFAVVEPHGSPTVAGCIRHQVRSVTNSRSRCAWVGATGGATQCCGCCSPPFPPCSSGCPTRSPRPGVPRWCSTRAAGGSPKSSTPHTCTPPPWRRSASPHSPRWPGCSSSSTPAQATSAWCSPGYAPRPCSPPG